MLWSLLRDSKGIDSRSKGNLLAGLSTTKIVRGENLTRRHVGGNCLTFYRLLLTEIICQLDFHTAQGCLFASTRYRN